MPQDNALRRRNEPPFVGIRVVREIRGLTLPALAERIETHLGKAVDPDHLSNVERGWKNPSNALLHAWALALGIEPLDVRPGTAIVPSQTSQTVAS